MQTCFVFQDVSCAQGSAVYKTVSDGKTTEKKRARRSDLKVKTELVVIQTGLCEACVVLS